MPHLRIHDSGPEFEVRALELARAIHDPSGSQGATMVDGRERDAIFVDDTSVTIYEFTTSNKKEKASGDAEKTVSALRAMASNRDNALKAMLGILVTAAEPTPDQRDVVRKTAERSRQNLQIISYATLKKNLIDAERYIDLRRNAPFGSAPQITPTHHSPLYVEPMFQIRGTADQCNLVKILERVHSGERTVVLADYGTGKSEMLRQCFERERKRYFKDAYANRFPLHINIRDCFGLRTPVEILRRHGEDLGFQYPNRLISAWRAGLVNLFLDGFDELIPSRWFGSATKLSDVRWRALAPVRELIKETPDECGIVIAGRPQYFAHESEIAEVLGLRSDALALDLLDFTLEQAREYLGDPALELPAWAPRRPLLIHFLRDAGYFEQAGGEHEDLQDGQAWRDLLSAIARREAERIDELSPQSVQDLLGRVATFARGGDDPTGPVDIEQLRRAFRDACGYDPDEQGHQLLLRLPGLAAATHGSPGDSRRFVDTALANAAFSHDLAKYIVAPYGKHPLSDSSAWPQASDSLVARITAANLLAAECSPGITNAAVTKRMNESDFDSTLFDVSMVGSEMGVEAASCDLFFSGVLIPELDLSVGVFRSATFASCIIEDLVADGVEEGDQIPTFKESIIGRVVGWANVPSWAHGFLSESEIGEYEPIALTTDGLGEMGLEPGERIAYTILKKVYMQAGRGRKFSALPRGLPLSLRSEVSGVTDQLKSLGFVVRQPGKGEELVLPVMDRRAEVLEILANPRRGGIPGIVG